MACDSETDNGNENRPDGRPRGTSRCLSPTSFSVALSRRASASADCLRAHSGRGKEKGSRSVCSKQNKLVKASLWCVQKVKGGQKLSGGNSVGVWCLTTNAQIAPQGFSLRGLPAGTRGVKEGTWKRGSRNVYSDRTLDLHYNGCVGCEKKIEKRQEACFGRKNCISSAVIVVCSCRKTTHIKLPTSPTKKKDFLLLIIIIISIKDKVQSGKYRWE